MWSHGTNIGRAMLHRLDSLWVFAPCMIERAKRECRRMRVQGCVGGRWPDSFFFFFKLIGYIFQKNQFIFFKYFY